MAEDTEDRMTATMTRQVDVPCYFPTERNQPPTDEERAEDVFDIPLGSVAHDSDSGDEWVFVGWVRNTAGTYPNFVKACTPSQPKASPLWEYHAAFAATLERKFPDISRFRRK